MATRGPHGNSHNPFLKQGLDLRDHIVHQYGPMIPLVKKMQLEHLRRKGGCHQCAKDVQDRMYGKVPVTVTHTGKNLQPIVLVSINDRPKIGIPELNEGADEGEYEELDESQTPVA
jgi:hypothetical protein